MSGLTEQRMTTSLPFPSRCWTPGPNSVSTTFALLLATNKLGEVLEREVRCIDRWGDKSEEQDDENGKNGFHG